jgi:hypothetical protein
MAIVGVVVGRDDVVEILGSASVSAVEVLAHDFFMTQLGAHRSVLLIPVTADSSCG